MSKISNNKSKILTANAANIDLCSRLLQNGKIVAIPTETVYGLAGNALSESSVSEIFSIKGRPLIDPLIVHFSSIKSAEAHIEPNDYVYRLAEAFWPGPLTLVIPKKRSIPDIVTAGLSSVAIRVPQHSVFRKILDRVDFPLAAPSANPFSYVSPTLADHVEQTLGDKIEAILDGGPCEYGLESTIVDLRNPKLPAILRPGPISLEQISEVLGASLSTSVKTPCDDAPQSAPGRLTKHYSPHAKIVLHEHGTFQKTHMDVYPLPEKTAIICSQKPGWYTNHPNTFWFSETGYLKTIASNLFQLIQHLDRLGFEEIRIETVSEEGLGAAINDRLRRAAGKSSAE